MKYLKHNGIVHKDIKPDNIMFESQDTTELIKLIDFGYSHDIFKDLSQSQNSIRNAVILGTPEYLAPEVINQNEC
jgi:serine/threonine protein kinase